MSVVGKEPRNANGKVPRKANGKAPRITAEGQGCCCNECPCGECDSESNCPGCACTPTQWTLTLEGLTAATIAGCYNGFGCDGTCAGGGDFGSVEVTGDATDLNGTYTLAQTGPCTFNYTTASPVVIQWWSGSDCTGTERCAADTLLIEFTIGPSSVSLRVSIIGCEVAQCWTPGSDVGVFLGEISRTCCTEDAVIPNDFDGAGQLPGCPMRFGSGEYYAAFDGTAYLTPC